MRKVDFRVFPGSDASRLKVTRIGGLSERAGGLFGVPSITVGDVLFRGDDRLEDALSWA
ncbi:hypothetical protein [Rhodosalinus sp. 5P4]|uniref:hypothetical protein n=1 Tax=Rhodosalinus sp. 5P4 TaxID=3239196 RepID=UPI003523510A